jgi:hypothetical protein
MIKVNSKQKLRPTMHNDFKVYAGYAVHPFPFAV